MGQGFARQSGVRGAVQLRGRWWLHRTVPRGDADVGGGVAENPHGTSRPHRTRGGPDPVSLPALYFFLVPCFCDSADPAMLLVAFELLGLLSAFDALVATGFDVVFGCAMQPPF